MPSRAKLSTEERVKARAHEIWEREGRPHGRHLAHWQQAEAEIAGEDAPKEAAPKQRAAAPANRSRATEDAAKALARRAATPASSRNRRKQAAE